MAKTVCHQCHNPYRSITLHWKRSSECSYPPIPDPVVEILSGIYSVRGEFQQQDNGRYLLRFQKNDKEPVETIHKALGVFATDYTTLAKENAYSNAECEQYQASTIVHPELHPDLLGVSSPLAYWAATIVAGGGNGSGSYRFVRKLKYKERMTECLSPISNTIKEVKENGTQKVELWVKKTDIEGIRSVSSPIGWWNTGAYAIE